MGEAARLIGEFLDRERQRLGREGTFLVPMPDAVHGIRPTAVTPEGRPIPGDPITPEEVEMTDFEARVPPRIRGRLTGLVLKLPKKKA